MSTSDHAIICAYEFTKSGKGIPLEGHAVADMVRAQKLAWVHLDATHEETPKWLHTHINYIDNLIIDALLEEETRPRINEQKDGMLIILRGVNMHEGADPEDMISIRLWIDEHRIISTQKRHLMAIDDIRKALDNEHGPKNAADFLVMLINNLIQRMDQVIADLDSDTDEIEETILDTPELEDRHKIIDIRRRAIILKRYFTPQREVLNYLRSTNIRWLDQSHKRQLQENTDRMTRYIDDLDAIRERAQIVKDELANIIADRMNKNMYVLSVVAAIFLPLSFLTGLLGINVGGMPGADNKEAFWIVCGICATFIITLSIYFKRKKWL